jgi:paraquat-inducible protein A
MPDPSSSANGLARGIAAAVVVTSASAFAVALALPTVTFDTIISAEETYSIYGGIESFWKDGNYILASIVFLFSIVFPVTKLLALGVILLQRGSRAARLRAVEWLELLGKWSMLDVFIICVFVGAIRLGIAHATSRPGIYLFAAAIAMSMIATVLVGRWLSSGKPREVRATPALRSWPARILTTLASATLVTALITTILQVERKLLFVPIVNSIDLPKTAWDLAQNQERFLAFMLGLFVVGAAAVRALLMLRVRWLPGPGATTLRAALTLDEWAMLDVFALGLVITYIKLAELTTTTLLSGFWWVLVAAALATADAWWYRGSVTR